MRNIYSALIFSGSMLVLCCAPDVQQKEYANLLHRASDLERRHCQLQASIDSLWDNTSLQLERALPAGFPAIDRDIFLKARNADHIRMFMSYKQLDSNTQSLVNDAGKQDEILAAQVRTLLEQRQEFERQKIQFLQKAERKDMATSRSYAAELRKVASGSCK